MKKFEKEYNTMFEKVKYYDENGTEYWLARELQLVLDYKEWRKFENVIQKAKLSCKNVGTSVFDHFVHAARMVNIVQIPKENKKSYQKR